MTSVAHPELPRIIEKYLPRICVQFLRAKKKHPDFASAWTRRNKVSVKNHLADVRQDNDAGERTGRQYVHNILTEETLEVMEAALDHDEAACREELLHVISVALRGLEKLDSEGL